MELENTIEDKMKVFERIHDKIKHKSFGKVTIGNKKIQHDKDSDTGNETEEEKAKNIFEEEVSRADEEIEEIKKLKISKVGKIWEMKKKIVGGKKASMETTAIVDPENNKLVVSKKQIISVTLKYCQETLNNNKPTEE